MATTTNYSWTTPDDTALVKDGAAAIRSLGSSIDSTLKTQIDAQIPDALLTTKGDLIAATGTSTPARLGVGTNGQVLTADSTAATGVKWAAAAGGLKNWTLVTSGSLSGTAVNLTGLSGYDNYILIANNISVSTSDTNCLFKFNSASTNYVTVGWDGTSSSTATTYASLIGIAAAATTARAFLTITGCLSTTNFKSYTFLGNKSIATAGLANYGGIYESTSAITEINISAAQSFDNGTYALYGSN